MTDTIVYIDGFNLYYRALKGTRHKWLDIVSLSEAVLPASSIITAIKYYTAHVSGRVNNDAPKKQNTYLKALSTLPKVQLFYGNFLTSKKWSGLVQPPEFRPSFPLPAEINLDVAYVWRTEEKGSDVNLGVHLVRDACMGYFKEAAVLTNDTDLVEPIRIVTEELGLPVTLLTPCNKPSTSLLRVASHVRHIDSYLGPCQLPTSICYKDKVITKPADW